VRNSRGQSHPPRSGWFLTAGVLLILAGCDTPTMAPLAPDSSRLLIAQAPGNVSGVGAPTGRTSAARVAALRPPIQAANHDTAMG
jgi:hypothetical protein